MADLQFIVDYSSVKKANQEILKTGSNAQKSAKVFEQAYKKVESAQRKAISDVKSQIAFSERMRRQREKESQEAVKALDRQRKAAQAYNTENQRLINKLNPLRAASQLYEKELNDINAAMSRGVINDRQRQKSLDALNAEFNQFATEGKAANAMNNRFAASTNVAGRRTNQLGVLMQQTGYQVGDFAVQVQSGTNVMVALGQQATQLVGTFGMLAKSTRMIGVFAGLGILIPILTGVAGAFMRMTENSGDATKAVDELSKSVSGYSSAVEVLNKSQSELTEEFGTFSGYAISAANALKSIALNEINEQVATLANRFTNVSNLMGRQIPSSINKTVRDFLELNSGISENNRIVAEFINSQIALSRAEGPKQQAEALNNLMELYTSLVGEQEGMTEEQEAYYLSLVQSLEQLSKFGAEQEGVTKSTKEQAGYIKEMSGFFKDIQSGYAATVGPAKTLRNETESYVESMSGVFNRAQGLKEELGDATFEVLRLADVDMESGVDAAAKAAARLAADLNISLAAALAMQSMASKEEQVMSQPVVTGPATDRFGAEDLLRMGYTEEYLKAIGKIRNRTGGGGGGSGGKSPAEIAQESLDKLREQLQVEEALIGKSEERKRIIKSLGVEFVNQNPEIVNGLEAQIQHIDEMTQREQQIKSFGETLKNSLGDAFLSIVDGSKSAGEAFRDMARLVLKQAFELLVIKPILNSIFGGGGGGFFSLFSANGNAFEQGGKVTAYANGGVVNAPTAFQHSGGLGVMGEAGPEAIMPLKRGKNGKLGVQMEGGNQGNVTVENHFHIAANGDESVKRIIAQEAPRIANLTQKQILDQRRRGGVMKTTFA